MDDFASYKACSIDEVATRLPPREAVTLVREFRRRSAGGRRVTVYSDGCFDMFHIGHARQLEQIKKMFANAELIVGVCSDEDIVHNKGSNVMNNKERCESVRHCKWVDRIVFPAPWTPTLKFMDEHGIDFVAHDTLPYAVEGSQDCYAPMKEAGRFIPTLRTEGISTTELLVRILKSREDFYERNLKKGYSRESMNLNYLEYCYIQMRGVVHNVQNCLKQEKEAGYQA